MSVRNIEFSYSFYEEKENNNEESRFKRFTIDSIFFYYLSRELTMCRNYVTAFKKFNSSRKFHFILAPTELNLIDFNWNERVYEMVREKCELDHALSWLSTLGGAFSALGDYFANCAETAGKISVNQLKLAFRLGDPTIASRCKLYFSLSLIQQKQFHLAQRIIYGEYTNATSARLVDERLVKMCKGIWSKLQYEHNLNRSKKKTEIM